MTEGTARLEAYLGELRARLHGLAESEIEEITAELRAHVQDSAGSDAQEGNATEAALARLGSPAELAGLFTTDRLLERAGRSRSPWVLLWSLLRWATVSVTGVLVLFPVLAGYLLAVSLFAAAVAKPFAPDRVGLWRVGSDELSIRLGAGEAAPPGAHELLGWWIVPIGLLVGGGALWLTLRFGRWALRRFRRRPLAAIG